MISKNTLKFLRELKKNNSKEWMDDNRQWYIDSKSEVVDFADRLIYEMNEHDELEPTSGKKCLFRINRDIRFSKDKTLYKSSFSGRFQRATETLRGGYYFHIEPGSFFLGGGFFGPNPEDLLHIRKQLEITGDDLRTIISSDRFKNTFGELMGDKVKTYPRGFSADTENIDLIKYKQFLVRHEMNEKTVLSEDFSLYVSNIFKEMRPFFDYMSEILTTDLNGVSRI